MLSFLHLARMAGLTVTAYEDSAEGTTAEIAPGRLAVTQVNLRPKIEWAGATPSKAELDRLRWQPRPEIVLNPRFELGSMLTVHRVAEAMTRGSGVLLMDADVLYDGRIAGALQPGDRIK